VTPPNPPSSESIFEAVAKRDYVIEAYVEAADKLKSYSDEGSPSDLLDAASALCEAMKRLGRDGGFWDAVAQLSSVAGSEREQAMTLMQDDIDELLRVEFDVLMRSGRIESQLAERLVVEARKSLENFAEWPDRASVKQLRNRIPPLADQICRLAGEAPRGAGLTRRIPKRLRRLPKPILRGAGFLGGATFASADGLAAAHTFGATLATGFGLASIGTGFSMMYTAAKG
jgi:hypothetical protein